MKQQQTLKIAILIGWIALLGISCKEATHIYEYDTYERLDSIPGPSITLTASAPNIDEDLSSTTRSSVVTATLSETATTATTISFNLVGSATNGNDYSLNRSSITIPAGQLSESITISALDDNINDDGETVVVDLAQVSGGDNAQESGTQQKIITITDNEGAPSVTLSKDLDNVTEGGDLTLTVRLSSVATTSTTVVLNAINGTAPVATEGVGFDYYFVSSPIITIAAGQLSDNITIRTRNDSIDDNAETITVEISSVSGGDGALESGIQQVTAIINDVTPPTGVTLNTSSLNINEAGGVALITASINPDANGNGPVAATSITLSTGGTATNLTDYTLSNTVISIPAGSLSSTVVLTGVDDNIDNATDPTVQLTISAITGADGYVLGVNPTTTITLLDDDSAGFTITESSGTSVSETGTSDTFSVVLDTEPTANITIALTDNDTDNSELTHNPASLIFSTGNWSVAQTVTVVGIDDSPTLDGDQYTALTLTASGDSQYNALSTQSVIVTTSDNDTASFSLSKTTATVSESGTQDDFTVVLNNGPTSNVTLNLSASNSSEATVSPASVT